MATVKFKAKVEDLVYVDGTHDHARVKVPALDRRHCDMRAFREHPKFRGFANSELFPGILKGALRRIGVQVGGFIRLDQVPEGVEIDTTGFLAQVTINV